MPRRSCPLARTQTTPASTLTGVAGDPRRAPGSNRSGVVRTVVGAAPTPTAGIVASGIVRAAALTDVTYGIIGTAALADVTGRIIGTTALADITRSIVGTTTLADVTGGIIGTAALTHITRRIIAATALADMTGRIIGTTAGEGGRTGQQLRGGKTGEQRNLERLAHRVSPSEHRQRGAASRQRPLPEIIPPGESFWKRAAME